MPAGAAVAEQLSSIFAPAGAPADAIVTLSVLVLAIAAGIFLIVGGLPAEVTAIVAFLATMHPPNQVPARDASQPLAAAR